MVTYTFTTKGLSLDNPLKELLTEYLQDTESNHVRKDIYRILLSRMKTYISCDICTRFTIRIYDFNNSSYRVIRVYTTKDKHIRISRISNATTGKGFTYDWEVKQNENQTTF